MTVIRNGNFHISSNNQLHNNHLYMGKDNRISISRVYSADFECKFAMQYYPFDIQQCNMNFILEVMFNFVGIFFYNANAIVPFHSFVKGTSGKDAELLKGVVDYFGAVDLLQYYVVSYEIVDNDLAETNASQIWAVQVYQMKLNMASKLVISSMLQIRVKLGRRIMNQAISQFLPAIIINVICYLTNYFKA